MLIQALIAAPKFYFFLQMTKQEEVDTFKFLNLSRSIPEMTKKTLQCGGKKRFFREYQFNIPKDPVTLSSNFGKRLGKSQFVDTLTSVYEQFPAKEI